jgi:proteasome lid subunit RPN8/RPN11
MQLAKSLYDQITAHAVETFPHECCGLVVERGGNVRVVRVTNVQNQRHAEDPERFPRTAEIAFTMGPEATPELIDHERGHAIIRAFYHSHPQHAAYFSAEDKKQATVWDEPSFPDAEQIVVSVFDRQVNDVKAFRWDERQRDFVEVGFSVSDA